MPLEAISTRALSPDAENNPPSPLGIRLLGIGQRHIVASRAGISAKRNPRKPFPSTPQTLGDFIQVKRLENGVGQRQLAQNLGVPVTLVRAWESDQVIPTKAELHNLSERFGFDFAATFANPTVE